MAKIVPGVDPSTLSPLGANETPLPGAEALSRLASFERFTFEFMRRIARRAPKALTTLYLDYVGANWIYYCTRHLIVTEGLEQVQHSPEDRILVVSNHRSFFDFYIMLSQLVKHRNLLHRMYFPVRADFFYERPTGIFINALIGGFAMYPPVFRQPEKRAFNRYALDETIALLRTPGVLMGFHPEGTRNKGSDPYSFLPAQPGVGEVCYKARPTQVLPVFINGLGNNIVTQIASNFDGTGEPICIVFGQPLDVSGFYAQRGRVATYKRLADRLMEEIGRLGAREKQLRQSALKNWPPKR